MSKPQVTIKTIVRNNIVTNIDVYVGDDMICTGVVESGVIGNGADNDWFVPMLRALAKHLGADVTVEKEQAPDSVDYQPETVPVELSLEQLASGHVQRLSDGTWEWSHDGGFDRGVVKLSPAVSTLLSEIADANWAPLQQPLAVIDMSTPESRRAAGSVELTAIANSLRAVNAPTRGADESGQR